MDLIKAIEQEQMKQDAENFHIGDTVKVYFKIVEGTTERVQIFEGIVIAKNNTGIRRTFTVRKNSYGVFMQAELLQSGNSLIYAGLNQIYAVEESIPEEESA